MWTCTRAKSTVNFYSFQVRRNKLTTLLPDLELSTVSGSTTAITEVGICGVGAAATWHIGCPSALSAHHSEGINKTLALLSRVKTALCNMLWC